MGACRPPSGASKKGMSAHQLHRMIGVTYKTAWFMFHRIREAMRSDDTWRDIKQAHRHELHREDSQFIRSSANTQWGYGRSLFSLR